MHYSECVKGVQQNGETKAQQDMHVMHPRLGSLLSDPHNFESWETGSLIASYEQK